MDRYQDFKKCDFAGLDQLPSHWKVKPLWSVSNQKSIIENEGLELLSVYLDKGVIRFSDVEQKRTNVTSEDTSKYQRVDFGDFVLNNQQAWRGSVGVSKHTGIVSPAYIVLEMSSELDPNFSSYLLRDQIMVGQYLTSSKGVGSIQRNLFIPYLRLNQIIIPPLNEQKLIARYLDKKTEQIDTLVEKIQKKIELLKEQRTSLINHYITKGLEPNVEMKDSGVEWIGEIPKHWEMTKLKYLCPNGVQYGLNIDSDSYQENGVRFVRITDITSDGKLKETDGVYLSPDNVPEEYYIKKNDILFSRSGGTVGKSIRIGDLNLDMSFAGYLVRFSFKDSGLSEFVKLITESGFFWKWIDIQIIQSTIQNVNGEKYSNFSFPLPSKDEQKSIVRFVQDKLNIIVKSIRNNESKTQLLLEYRQSLISSVVTGKVRITEDMI